MLFKYEAKTPEGKPASGTIEAASLELAVTSLQRKNLIIVSVYPLAEGSFFKRGLTFFERVKSRDIVILSRQLATLFEAKVPVLESFKVLANEADSPVLRRHLFDIIEDIEGGIPMSQAMARHQIIFSNFYINMVRSGEESGKLDEIFSYLADHLERSYELNSKVKNALIYPAFVFFVLIVVMALMMVVIVPRLSSILTESGQELPIFTRIIIGLSFFLRKAGVILLLGMAGGIIFLWRYMSTEKGKLFFSMIQIKTPIIKKLFKQFFLSRIADNLNTLLSGGVPLVRALEITSDVVGNEIYSRILKKSIESIKKGETISHVLGLHKEILPLFSQMVKIGEETGKLSFMLETIATFYRKETNHMVENLVTLIEPIMIIVLGLGVGIIVTAVLMPIYNMTAAF
jgi:type IV pilus assembly protein PilC